MAIHWVAQQLVADRWHLVAYMRDAIERLLLRQHAKLREAATSLSEVIGLSVRFAQNRPQQLLFMIL